MNLLHGAAHELRQNPPPGLMQELMPGAGGLLADDFSPALPWYVVHTKVRQEQKACENLARQGFAVYLPRLKVLKRCRGRQQARLEPLFPRYIFLQPGSAAHSIATVRSTLGVAGIVRFGQEPAAIRPETLKNIRDFETRQNEAPDEDISPFQPGERIRVADGPLTGLEGLISKVSQQRVIVLMHLLGTDTRVSLSRHQLLLAN
jgi:transcriptional antiterminator RfaH